MTKAKQVPDFFELNPAAGAEVTVPRFQQNRRRLGGRDLWAIIAACVIAVLMIVLATQLHAQISTVQRNFAGGADSANPSTVLTVDHTELTH
jgi:hypothetical protein